MHTPALTTRLATLALALTSLSAVLHADANYDAPFAPYSVTVHASSTLFADTVTFNGGTAAFRGLGSLQGTDGSGPVLATLDGTLSATFVADPGYVFDSVALSFGQWSFSNSLGYGGHGHSGTWFIPGSTYAGGTNPSDAGATSDAWSGNGPTGTFSHYNFNWWTGGGNSWLALMDGAIQLHGMSSFTLHLDLSMFVVNTSSYGLSSFDATVVSTLAPPPGNTVPEGPLHPALFAGVLSAVLLLGTRARPHLREASR